MEAVFVEGDDPMTMHRLMAETLNTVIEEIKEIQRKAREEGCEERPFWPMIVLRTPKGWTGPKVVDGLQIEGSFRAHQVPIMMDKPEHLELLKNWLLSYKPEELLMKITDLSLNSAHSVLKEMHVSAPTRMLTAVSFYAT